MVVAVDIDGTLYDGVEVAPDAIRELQKARDDGHMVVIVTGRRWEELGTVAPDVVRLASRAVSPTTTGPPGRSIRSMYASNAPMSGGSRSGGMPNARPTGIVSS